MWPLSRRPAALRRDLPSPSPCERWPKLEYHRCVWPRGHRPPCKFEAIGRAPTVRLPDDATLHRRRLDVLALAENLHADQRAQTAWGVLGLAERRALGSRIADLRWRNTGLDGGLDVAHGASLERRCAPPSGGVS